MHISTFESYNFNISNNIKACVQELIDEYEFTIYEDQIGEVLYGYQHTYGSDNYLLLDNKV